MMPEHLDDPQRSKFFSIASRLYDERISVLGQLKWPRPQSEPQKNDLFWRAAGLISEKGFSSGEEAKAHVLFSVVLAGASGEFVKSLGNTINALGSR
jgi:hypothetical protein